MEDLDIDGQIGRFLAELDERQPEPTAGCPANML